jgi:endonuclease/exonuclease/phosphatase family metal-dependent hydrolase
MTEISDPIESRLRVVSWNIWWRYGPWERRRPVIEATLRALDADVIALQEVWDDGAANLAADLAQALDRNHVYQGAEKRDGLGLESGLAAPARTTGER